jgi:hypothetical protein
MLLERRCLLLLVLALGALLPTRSAHAQVVVTINGDTARADITLAAPGGPYTAELTLEFRDPVNLSAACLGISAVALDAAGIAAANARLPSPTLEIDPAFPVVITVEPPAACGLSFRGEYRVELRTANLVFNAPSVYRLYKAPIGTSFVNITSGVVAGSVRARGAGGNFSEFAMIRDNAQDYATQLEAAYLALEDRLDDPEIGVTAMTTLLNDLTASRAAAAAADYPAAIAAMQRLNGHAAAFSEDGVPGRWRAQRDLNNVEGDLVSESGVIQFLLGRLDGD